MGFDPRGGGTTGTTSGGSKGFVMYLHNGTTYVLAPGQTDDGVSPRWIAFGTAAQAAAFIGSTPRPGDAEVNV